MTDVYFNLKFLHFLPLVFYLFQPFINGTSQGLTFQTTYSTFRYIRQALLPLSSVRAPQDDDRSG